MGLYGPYVCFINPLQTNFMEVKMIVFFSLFLSFAINIQVEGRLVLGIQKRRFVYKVFESQSSLKAIR